MTQQAYDGTEHVDPARDDQMPDQAMQDDRMDDGMRADDRMDGRGSTSMVGEEGSELFEGQDAQLFRQRWEQVQSRFVDDPRGAVADADALVSDVTQTLSSRFAEQKTTLEQQWSQGDDVQTEDLRQTMQRYRTLFERLLAA